VAVIIQVLSDGGIMFRRDLVEEIEGKASSSATSFILQISLEVT
jgi:hypothetical protein